MLVLKTKYSKCLTKNMSEWRNMEYALVLETSAERLGSSNLSSGTRKKNKIIKDAYSKI